MKFISFDEIICCVVCIHVQLQTVRYQNDFPDALVIAHYIGATAASSDLGHMLRRIISEIVSFYKVDRSSFFW